MICESCDSGKRVNWSPLARAYLCSFCLDKWTSNELRPPKTKEWLAAHGADISNLLGVPQWLVGCPRD